jgi:hypothetical protein
LEEDFPLLWPKEKVNPGEALTKVVDFRANHTASESDDRTWRPPLQTPEGVELVDYFILGILTHHAAIEQNHLSLISHLCARVP